MKVSILLLCFFISQSLAEPKKSPLSPQEVRLAIGFYFPSLNNVSSRTDIQIALNYWIKELTHSINLYNNSTVLYNRIADMKSDFLQGRLDMIIAPPLLLAIHFDRELLSDGFMGVNSNNKTDQLVIIARQGDITSSVDFLEKRLILLKDDLLAKLFMETEVMKQFHRSYQQVFSSVKLEKKNHRIILDLFFAKADVAVVYLSALDVMIELNPQVAKKIKIIKTFPVNSTNYGYFHRDYNYQGEFRKAANKFVSEPRGKQVMEMFNNSGIATCKVDELKVFDDFYQTYLRLIKNHGKE